VTSSSEPLGSESVHREASGRAFIPIQAEPTTISENTPDRQQLLTALHEIRLAHRYIDERLSFLSYALGDTPRPVGLPTTSPDRGRSQHIPTLQSGADTPRPAAEEDGPPGLWRLIRQYGAEITVGIVAAAIAVGIVVYMFTGGYR
jgi:hypothetical protein